MLELSLNPEPSTPLTSDETAAALPGVNDVPELGITEDAAHKCPLSDFIANAAHTSTTVFHRIQKVLIIQERCVSWQSDARLFMA
jgi:hypothetical protein